VRQHFLEAGVKRRAIFQRRSRTVDVRIDHGRALEDASPALPAEGGEKTLDPATLDKNRVFKVVER
jgi:hypothetical protein